ncbi:T9SS type A sorting domain-containing protein, partial [bacterium]|nr:T9SS type A sorting domain-containing protein [bacterium]
MKLNIRKYLLFIAIFALLSLTSYAEEAIKCGTWNNLSSKHQIASRPELSDSLLSPSSRFMIHFTETGEDSVAEGFPELAAQILDSMWQHQVVDLGYNAPPLDHDGYIHLYFENLKRLYGRTDPEQNNGNNLRSFMVLENDFAEDVFSTHGIDALRVTLAHEFHHVVQFGYRLDRSQLSFYEMTAVWMEENTYPEINDYVNYLRDLFRRPYRSLTERNGNREYAAGIYIIFLAEKYGVEFIRDTWSQFSSNSGLNLFEQLHVNLNNLERTPSVSHEEAAKEYMLWCIFSGDRTVPGFGFPDAPLFKTLTLDTVASGSWEADITLGEWGFSGVEFLQGIQQYPHPEIQGNPENTVTVWAARADDEVTWPQPGYSLPTIHGQPGYVAFMSVQHGSDLERDFHVSAQEAILESQYTVSSVYPNPAKTGVYWNMRSNLGDDFEFEIFNILGQKVYS